MQGRWREAYVHWRDVVAEQRSSGLSAAAFCRGRGITTGQFFAWKKRLREAEEEGQFVPVRVVAAPLPVPAGAAELRRRSGIEVRLAGGRRLFVEPGFDAEHLQAVAAALEAR